MPDTLTIRASALPRALRCPASVLSPGDRVDPVSEAAALGVAVHEALAVLVATGSVRWDDLPALAARHGVPEDDVRVLCGQAARMWADGLGAAHPAATAEVAMSETVGGLTITGTADALVHDEAAVLDWKSGRVDADHGDQLAAYAWLAVMDAGADTARTTVAWIRDGEIETRTWTRDALRAWAAAAAARRLGWAGRTWRPRAGELRTGPTAPEARRRARWWGVWVQEGSYSSDGRRPWILDAAEVVAGGGTCYGFLRGLGTAWGWAAKGAAGVVSDTGAGLPAASWAEEAVAMVD